jgi:hypothetical protein
VDSEESNETSNEIPHQNTNKINPQNGTKNGRQVNPITNGRPMKKKKSVPNLALSEEQSNESEKVSNPIINGRPMKKKKSVPNLVLSEEQSNESGKVPQQRKKIQGKKTEDGEQMSESTVNPIKNGRQANGTGNPINKKKSVPNLNEEQSNESGKVPQLGKKTQIKKTESGEQSNEPVTVKTVKKRNSQIKLSNESGEQSNDPVTVKTVKKRNSQIKLSNETNNTTNESAKVSQQRKRRKITN